MGLIDTLRQWAASRSTAVLKTPETLLPNEERLGTSERGQRPNPDNALKYQYRLMYADPDLRQAVLDLRDMDRQDGRVRRIHSRIARDTVKGGLVFTQPKAGEVLRREWDAFARRLQLANPEKLKSDARGLIMEGNLPMQWVLDSALDVVAAIRMPSETIIPDVTVNGRFKDVRRAYQQVDFTTGGLLAEFPLWQLTLARYDPDSYDDMGALGRPFLDASRSVWRKLKMTEEDLVIRRRQRAPLRMAHVLEGATGEDVETYRKSVERDAQSITTDFYLNKKGGVSAVQGDANLDQIADVVHLLDSFFSGSPLPKGLMGYTDGMARDILEDLKRDYYDEVDLIQDTLAYVYRSGFCLHLLLKGINPDDEQWTVKFAERRTETPNQTTDRALKMRALGLPHSLVWEEMGYNPEDILDRLEEEARSDDPYPNQQQIGPAGGPKVSVTPGNAPKGESATSVTHDRRLPEHWPSN